MELLYPKIKSGVIIKAFDDDSCDEKYIMSYNSRSWVIVKEFYSILTLMDGTRSCDEICRDLCKINKIESDKDDIESIIRNYLSPKGLLENTESTEEAPAKGSKFLWLQIPLIKSDRLCKLRFLSIPFIKSVSVILFLLTIPGVAVLFTRMFDSKTYSLLYNMSRSDLSVLFITFIISAYLHEFGHVGACLRFGTSPNHIGFGLYMTMPVLYADVTNVWGLKRSERAIVDLGGVYFEFLFLSMMALYGLLSSNPIFIVSALMRLFGLINNFNPFLKMDGYWLFSDLSGISNLHDMYERYILYNVRKALRKDVKNPLDEHNIGVKRWFKCYVGVSFIFYGLFAFMMGTVIITSINTMPQFFEAISSIAVAGTVADVLRGVWNLITGYAVVFISFIMVGRIVYVGSKKLMGLSI